MWQAPDNLIHRGQPSRTAWRVAEQRAVHALLDDPVVHHDPVALTMLGADEAQRLRANPFSCNDPMSRGLRAAVVARSRIAEDELARRVSMGVRQYVVLGAGLDTFAARNVHAAAGLKVFEVDHPSTQRWKREALATAGLATPEVVFVPADLERADLMATLAAAGLQLHEPVFVAWLGVTYYLSAAAVRSTLHAIAQSRAGSGIVFDYRVPPMQLNLIERTVIHAVAMQLAAQGEPWRSDFEPDSLVRELQTMGFTDVVDLDGPAINQRCFDRRRDGLHAGNAMHIICASV
ncbi:class I SAM-dependent methyltransferase [Ideonella sp. DXS29W]|uniref:S-adenosyl-L-methionine-dependent methyltransferase n=1 Tax=Ideonella lacteola TaxID=2984193 RepID=A0ABU9BVW9_9BURK